MASTIQIENVSKMYRLGQIGTGTISHDLNKWWCKLRGKPDPYQRIGKVNDRENSGGDYVWALKDVNLNIEQGQILGIIGRNGAGKSTLLKLLSRVTAPTTGDIRVKGRLASLLEVGTGFHPELTGRENIFLNGAILGMTRVEIRRQFDAIVDFSGCGKYIDTPVKRYSSGMYVRLAFAVAAHLESEILVVDEVLAVGDADFQSRCLGKMEDVSRTDGRTILFVSHNMGAVEKLCSQAIWLTSGQITAKDLSSKVVMDYLGSISNLASIKQIGARIGKLPFNPRFRLIDVNATQNGSSLTKVQTFSGKPIEVSIDYEVKQRTSNFRIYLDILDRNGTLLIKSFHDCDFSEPTVAKPGRYTSRVVIPGDFLAPKEYILRIGATIFGNCELSGPGFSFAINVCKAGRVNRAYALNVEVGKLAPLLNWETKKVVL